MSRHPTVGTLKFADEQNAAAGGNTIPTYEAAAAVALAAVVMAVTRKDRALGGAFAAVAAAVGLFVAVVWELYFGGRVIMVGGLIGFGLGRWLRT